MDSRSAIGDHHPWGKDAFHQSTVGSSVFSGAPLPGNNLPPVSSNDETPSIGQIDPIKEHLVTNLTGCQRLGYFHAPTPAGFTSERGPRYPYLVYWYAF